jgi:hypothetical protein
VLVVNRLLAMLFSRHDYAWSCRAESNNLNNFYTLPSAVINNLINDFHEVKVDEI